MEEELESSPRERLQQARQGTARQPVGGVTSRPRPEGEQGLADEGEDDADSASLSGPYIQPEPVDWMEGEEEGMAEDLEGSADDEEGGWTAQDWGEWWTAWGRVRGNKTTTHTLGKRRVGYGWGRAWCT